MTKKKMESFRKILDEQVSKLINEAQETIGDMTDVKENLPDPTDSASFEVDRNFLLRIRDRERKLILKIKEAIQRIDDGSFGTCELCGEQISEQRLKARPVTTQCIECKTEMENEEKRSGLE
ncbi:MAG: RNA polymerase-binding protein DksA [Pseudomonadota bacterium]